ncbi:MAG TPA: riboflavin biosynthesis protein RibD, partial [Clostridiales bacterium UBA8960]|nr:riboflavin biosynthesis protein RibD [Clostridiales bacterium UBA8960]
NRAPKDKIKALESLGAEVLILPELNGQVDLSEMVACLGKHSIDSVLVEGGAELNYALLRMGLIDKVVSFIAPKLIGGRNAKTPVGGEGIPVMNDAIKLTSLSVSMIGCDVMIEGYIDKEASCLPD